MPRPYSGDLRARVIEDISTGASRREAAERYGVSPSVVVLWAQRFERTGSVAAKPSGGSTSPLEEHADFLLGLIVEQPDLTLDEVVAAMKKRRIPGSRSAVLRFFDRRAISFKKNFVEKANNGDRVTALTSASLVVAYDQTACSDGLAITSVRRTTREGRRQAGVPEL